MANQIEPPSPVPSAFEWAMGAWGRHPEGMALSVPEAALAALLVRVAHLESLAWAVEQRITITSGAPAEEKA